MDSARHRSGLAGGRFSHSWPLILTIGLVGLSALTVGIRCW
jgi:hypothetical protein